MFLSTEMNAFAWAEAGILLVAMVLVNLEGADDGGGGTHGGTT